MNERLVRLTWPWRIIAPAFALIAVAYPFLVTQIEMRALDSGDIAAPLLIFTVAVAYWWYAAHSATIGTETVTFHSPGCSRTVVDADIEAIDVNGWWVVVRDRGGRRHRVSSYAQNSALLVRKTKGK